MNEQIRELREFYVRVDEASEFMNGIHARRLQCSLGCSSCCQDGIAIFAIEAENIRSQHQDLLARGEPHPDGACAFLDDDGACRIYEDRPYVCRTQGYPLRWLEERDDGTSQEMRDICPLNEHGEPVVELPAEQCWTIGRFEGQLALLQYRFGHGSMDRVPLRDLFSG